MLLYAVQICVFDVPSIIQTVVIASSIADTTLQHLALSCHPSGNDENSWRLDTKPTISFAPEYRDGRMRLCIYFQRDTKKQEKDTRTRETRSGHIPRARPLSSARAAILPFLLFLVEIGGLSQAIETLEKSHFKVLCISVFFFVSYNDTNNDSSALPSFVDYHCSAS